MFGEKNPQLQGKKDLSTYKRIFLKIYMLKHLMEVTEN
jgi:hypothetical protein